MGDEHQRHATFRLLRKQQIGDLATGLDIEIAGGFIGNQHGGRGGKRARYGNALLLAAGELAGIVVETLAKADGLKFLPRDIEGIADVCEFQRNRDVFQRSHIGDQVEGLKDDADVLAAEIGERIFAKAMQRRAVDIDFTAVEPFQPGQHHQQGGLSRTGRTDDADRFTLRDREIDILQHMDRGCCVSERQIGLVEFDDGFSHAFPPYIEWREEVVAHRHRLRQFRKGTMIFKAVLLHFAVILGTAFPLAASASAEPLQLVGFGDSLMAGYQLPPDDALPTRLQAALVAKGYDVSISNAGVSGDTTSAGLARIDWSVPDGTDGVLLELGANDALRGIAPEETERNLESIVSRLKERGIPVLLVGMLSPPNMGEDYAKRFNGIYPRLAEKYGLAFYPFVLDGVAAQAELQLEDGMHPNAKGVGVMVERMLPVTESFIATISGKPK